MSIYRFFMFGLFWTIEVTISDSGKFICRPKNHSDYNYLINGSAPFNFCFSKLNLHFRSNIWWNFINFFSDGFMLKSFICHLTKFKVFACNYIWKFLVMFFTIEGMKSDSGTFICRPKKLFRLQLSDQWCTLFFSIYFWTLLIFFEEKKIGAFLLFDIPWVCKPCNDSVDFKRV